MRLLAILLLAVTLWALPVVGADAASPELNLLEIRASLSSFSAEGRALVESAIDLIKAKEHAAALVRLGPVFRGKEGNPSLRLLSAFLKLELGNLLGAFEDAQKAEATQPYSAYRCWFLAKVAAAVGNEAACRREARHLAGDPVYGPQAKALARQMAQRRRSK